MRRARNGVGERPQQLAGAKGLAEAGRLPQHRLYSGKMFGAVSGHDPRTAPAAPSMPPRRPVGRSPCRFRSRTAASGRPRSIRASASCTRNGRADHDAALHAEKLFQIVRDEQLILDDQDPSALQQSQATQRASSFHPHRASAEENSAATASVSCRFDPPADPLHPLGRDCPGACCAVAGRFRPSGTSCRSGSAPRPSASHGRRRTDGR